MNESFGNMERIEAYLENKLSGEELNNFLSELNSNEQLKQDLEIHQLMHASVHAVGKQDLKNELKEIHQDLFKNAVNNSGNGLKYGLIIGGIITISAIAYFYPNQSKSVVKEAPTEIQSPHLKKLEPRSKETITQKETIEVQEEEQKRHENLVKTKTEKPIDVKPNPEAGEIHVNIRDKEKVGMANNIVPELVTSDTMDVGYLYDGKVLKFYNLNDKKIDGLEELDGQLKYLIYDQKLYQLDQNSKPSPLIEVTDDNILFNYGL